MKNIFKALFALIIVIVFIGMIIWTNYLDLKDIFSGKKKNFVACTEFTTNNNKLKPHVNKINDLKKQEITTKGFKCDDLEIIDADLNSKDPSHASIIWGLYEKTISYNLRDYDLSGFLFEFYNGKLQPDDQKRIIDEIKSWVNDPQMPENLKVLITERVK